jgi:hypothetical protein
VKIPAEAASAAVQSDISKMSILAWRAAVRCCEQRGLSYQSGRRRKKQGAWTWSFCAVSAVQSAVRWFDDVTDI